MSDSGARPGARPARIRVTAPRTGRPRRTTVASEIDAQSEVGAIFMRSLMRSQLRLAAETVLVLACTVGLLPLLFLAVPATRTVRMLGVPLPWLLLGFAVYPFLLAVAWLHVRRAERNEAAFLELARFRQGEGTEPR
ncbi:MAG: hypothetical protein ACTHJH_12895 [Marmoricola sp.]